MVLIDPVSDELVFRLLLAVALGGVVGFERELTHKPAGLRTHMLVSLGAALFGILAGYFTSNQAGFAAGIITGIGFIGGGSIIALRGHVQGITTAASLWTVAAIGLSTGLGGYIIASVAAVLVFAILQIKRAEKNLEKIK